MTDTYIQYNDLSIDSAFKDHYVVPDYQREYVWSGKQVEQLLDDLVEAYDADSKKAYFLGTIVTYHPGSYYELIDGQQRLTTFFLLLCAVKNIYSAAGEETSVIKNLIYSPTMNESGDTVNRYHLQLQYEDTGNCLELIEQGREAPDDLTLSGRRLFEAYQCICGFFSERFPNIADMKKFVFFLLNKTSFVRIKTYDIADALKIFETINQRGMGLDPMDLLKNMVFRQVDRDRFKELNMDWKSITHSLEEIDEKPLRFLRYFIMANYDTSGERDGILREDQIYSWLSRNNAQCRYEEAPFQFVQKMKQSVALYVKYRSPSDSSGGNIHLKNIPLLAGQSYRLHLMLLLAASRMDVDALAQFKGVVESVVYYSVINKITTNTTERIFVAWCRDIRNISTVPELDAFVRTVIVPTVDDWKRENESNFLRLGLNSMQQYRIKFILGKITAYVDALRLGASEAGELKSYMQSGIEIEHIMPRTCADKAAYGMSEEDFPIYINRLGNLTLLENSINKSIQNDVYAHKAQSYRQSKFYLTSSLSGLTDQGHDTAINRTNQLLRAWPTWDKQAIEERQRMLYALSEMIWKI